MSKRRRRSSTPDSPSTRSHGLLLRALIIIAAGFAVYANSLAGPFVFDDQSSVVENPAIRSVATVLTEPRNSPMAGRPVAALTMAADYAVGGLDVGIYHLTNIAIHLGCALLLFGLVRRTLDLPRWRTRFGASAQDIAFAAALLWVVHPLASETVNYVTQRTESLMALFYLLTLYAGLRAATEEADTTWLGVAMVACALGMASKESMVTAPVMVLLYDRTFLFNSFTDAMKARWRFYAGLAASWLLLGALMLPGPRARTVGFTTGIAPWSYLLNQAAMITRYLRLTMWPRELVVAYGPPFPVSFGNVALQALLIGGLLIGTTIALFRRPTLGFLGAWVFIILAPTSSIVPIATEVGAERRMYLPLMALVVLSVLATQSVRRVPAKAWAGVLAAIALALGGRTVARNQDYSSGVRLAQSVVRYWPSDTAHSFLGGELAAAGRTEEAIPELRIGAGADPKARFNLGIALLNLSRYDEGIVELQRVAREFPFLTEATLAHRAAGEAFAVQQKWPDAVTELRITVAALPNDPEVRAMLVDGLKHEGAASADAGDLAGAVQAFREASQLDPSDAGARGDLSLALQRQGQPSRGHQDSHRHPHL